MVAVTIHSNFRAQENKICHCFPQSICHEVMGRDAMIFVYWMLSFKPGFSLSFFTLFRRLFSSLIFAIKVVSSAYLRDSVVTQIVESVHNVGDLSLIPGLGRSPAEGNGNPLQYSCLENPMDGGAWWAIVPRVAELAWFSDFTFTSSAYLRLLIFLLAILIPACASSSLVFHMMYSA